MGQSHVRVEMQDKDADVMCFKGMEIRTDTVIAQVDGKPPEIVR